MISKIELLQISKIQLHQTSLELSEKENNAL